MKPQPSPQMSSGMLARLMNPTNDTVAQKATSSANFPMSVKKSMKYQKSMLGSQHIPKAAESQLAHASSGGQSSQPKEHIQTGQNRPSAGFQEPPHRGYNPYS